MTISADKLSEQNSYDLGAEKKESKINSRYEGTFPPLFSPKGRPLCDTSVLHRDPRSQAKVCWGADSFPCKNSTSAGPRAAVSAEHGTVWRQHWVRASQEVREAALRSVSQHVVCSYCQSHCTGPLLTHTSTWGGIWREVVCTCFHVF